MGMARRVNHLGVGFVQRGRAVSNIVKASSAESALEEFLSRKKVERSLLNIETRGSLTSVTFKA